MPDLRPPVRSGPVSRRDVVIGAVASGAALSLTGCSSRPERSATAPRAERDEALSPDEAAVVALAARLEHSTLLLTRTSTRYPRLGRDLAALLATEREHRRLLSRSASAAKLPARDVVPVTVAASREAARQAALVDARALRGTLFASAGRAQSGQFARLLASMGCALSQRLEGLA